jgi:hypothetical protein
MKEYRFSVYDVDDGGDVYFDGLEGPYSVVEGECCRRGMRKEYQVDIQIMNHTSSAWYIISMGGVYLLLYCWIKRMMYQPFLG